MQLSHTIERLKKRILLSVGGLLISVIVISGWSLFSQYNDIIASAEQRAASFARLLAQHSESAFAESDRVLRDTLQDIRNPVSGELLDPLLLHQAFKRQAANSPQIGSIFIVDKNGDMLANSNQFPQKPINVADREYFQYYLTTPGADFTISRPVLSRLVNRWRFNLIRPLSQKKGNFEGIASVAFEVSYFSKFLGPSAIGPRGRIILLHTNGFPLVHEPNRENAYQLDFRNTALFTSKLPTAPSGTYHVTHSDADKESRIVSYQRLSRYPVISVVALHRDDVLEPWVKRALFQGSLTLVLCAFIVLLARFTLKNLNFLLKSQQTVADQQRQLKIKAAQIDAADDAILTVDEHGRLINFNQALCTMTGYAAHELEGIRLHDIEPADYASKIDINISTIREKRHATFESAFISKEGRVISTDVHARVMETEGQLLILSVVRDITRRKRDESREKDRLLILEEMACGAGLPQLLEMIVAFVEQQIPGALCSVLLADKEGTRLRHGAAPSLPDAYNASVDGLRIAEGMGSCGTAAFTRKRVIVEDIEGHPYWKGYKPAREAGLRACWSEPILAHDNRLLGTFAMYYRIPKAPGAEEIRLIESAAHLASIAIDRVWGEDERRRLEEQLAHIQKIEAIGQLAGGIAHDFNNLLTPILVYTDMVKRSLPDGHDQLRRLNGVQSAAQKAKELTQKLLSFGRKQMLCMETFDLNEIIESFHDILTRTIRENITIHVAPAPGGALLKADRGQIEQVLLNLTVNAQDAIEGNGSIEIETGHVLLDDEFVRLHHGMEAGQYILLTFRDSGCGMDDATLKHIFEPFFTTKAPGHGTGLGLATVYGIVKQHGGYIEVRSHTGAGTTFMIYLPAAAAESAQREATPDKLGGYVRAKGKATILLVEDNRMVRDMTHELLDMQGFTVLVAESPTQALELERQHTGTIDLLVTDIVMPGMNGIELYGNIQERRSGLPVLYISGYTNDVVVHDGTLEEQVNFLKKPFSSEQLIDKVWHLLSREHAKTSGPQES